MNIWFVMRKEFRAGKIKLIKIQRLNHQYQKPSNLSHPLFISNV